MGHEVTYKYSEADSHQNPQKESSFRNYSSSARHHGQAVLPPAPAEPTASATIRASQVKTACLAAPSTQLGFTWRSRSRAPDGWNLISSGCLLAKEDGNLNFHMVSAV